MNWLGFAIVAIGLTCCLTGIFSATQGDWAVAFWGAGNTIFYVVLFFCLRSIDS